MLMSSKITLRGIPRIISDHPVAQSGWYIKLIITPRDQPQPQAVQLHKVPNIQHTLTPATMFCRIASFLKKPQCNYLVTICGSANYHCPRHTQDVLSRKTTEKPYPTERWCTSLSIMLAHAQGWVAHFSVGSFLCYPRAQEEGWALTLSSFHYYS